MKTPEQTLSDLLALGDEIARASAEYKQPVSPREARKLAQQTINALPAIREYMEMVEGLREVIKKHAEQHEMMAEMAARVESGSPVYSVEGGKQKRKKFATVVRIEAEASASHARATLSRLGGK